jgi:hypothetical protein
MCIRDRAKLAPEIATHRGNRIRKRSRQEMKQGFFFDGIDMAGNDFAINQGEQFAGLILTHAAKPPAAFFYDTAMAAQAAFYFVIFQRGIQVGFHLLTSSLLSSVNYRRAQSRLDLIYDKSEFQNLYPVESSTGGPPLAAFHRASLKSRWAYPVVAPGEFCA